MTRYPKLLPWMAKKFDLPVELAEKLWRRALGDAIELAGCAEGPEVSRFATERFLDLMEGEASGASVSTPAPGSEWFWRHQRRMAAMSFSATNASCRWWDAAWQRLQSRRFVA